jgi:carbon monoxide dehydrogenase subunit G
VNLSDHQRIEAPKPRVWAALNDPEILRQCIPGCNEIELISSTEMAAKATIKIGPITATFRGRVTFSDIDPPNGYTISGEGQGGVAGVAKGSAVVRLDEAGSATVLHYDVKADVGGKIAQLGARLIDATARKLAGEFFSKLSALVAAEPSELNVIIQSEAIVPHRLSWLSRLRNWLFHRGRQVK